MRLIIVSGRSGSGKSTALNVLEDVGYYCIDNLPAGLLPDLIKQAQATKSPEYEHMAVSIDARNATGDFAAVPALLKSLGDDVDTDVIYLDANSANLIKRFSETRRKHPLSNQHTALKTAIEDEKLLLEPLASAADLTINTSDMSVHDLRDLIKKRVTGPDSSSGMSILFISFGFKRGIPIDADFVFDVRCLPNPYWVPDIRGQTGLEEGVTDYLDKQPEVQEMFDDISNYLEKWLPRFEANNRSYLSVAIGCTGGQHRSVYISERLKNWYSQKHENVQVHHRELLR